MICNTKATRPRTRLPHVPENASARSCQRALVQYASERASRCMRGQTSLRSLDQCLPAAVPINQQIPSKLVSLAAASWPSELVRTVRTDYRFPPLLLCAFPRLPAPSSLRALPPTGETKPRGEQPLSKRAFFANVFSFTSSRR